MKIVLKPHFDYLDICISFYPYKSRGWRGGWHLINFSILAHVQRFNFLCVNIFKPELQQPLIFSNFWDPHRTSHFPELIREKLCHPHVYMAPRALTPKMQGGAGSWHLIKFSILAHVQRFNFLFCVNIFKPELQ